MSTSPARSAGFTLVELMVTVTLLSIIVFLAAPSMMGWIKNSQVRATSDALQNGLRLAQAESLRRSRQVVFSLTDSASPQSGFTAKADGKYWSINTIGIQDESTDVAAFIESGALDVAASEVSIRGPATVCFSSLGRLVVNSEPGVGVGCASDAIPAAYNVSMPGADRSLRVTVAVGGQVRMCDPSKTLSTTAPDGC